MKIIHLDCEFKNTDGIVPYMIWEVPNKIYKQIELLNEINEKEICQSSFVYCSSAKEIFYGGIIFSKKRISESEYWKSVDGSEKNKFNNVNYTCLCIEEYGLCKKWQPNTHSN
jgi:hypothetical protein